MNHGAGNGESGAGIQGQAAIVVGTHVYYAQGRCIRVKALGEEGNAEVVRLDFTVRRLVLNEPADRLAVVGGEALAVLDLEEAVPAAEVIATGPVADVSSRATPSSAPTSWTGALKQTTSSTSTPCRAFLGRKTPSHPMQTSSFLCAWRLGPRRGNPAGLCLRFISSCEILTSTPYVLFSRSTRCLCKRPYSGWLDSSHTKATERPRLLWLGHRVQQRAEMSIVHRPVGSAASSVR